MLFTVVYYYYYYYYGHLLAVDINVARWWSLSKHPVSFNKSCRLSHFKKAIVRCCVPFDAHASDRKVVVPYYLFFFIKANQTAEPCKELVWLLNRERYRSKGKRQGKTMSIESSPVSHDPPLPSSVTFQQI